MAPGAKRIGELLLEKGLITPADLDKALSLQKDNPGRLLGEIFLTLNLFDGEQFQSFLKDTIQNHPDLKSHMNAWLSQEEIDKLLSNLSE